MLADDVLIKTLASVTGQAILTIVLSVLSAIFLALVNKGLNLLNDRYNLNLTQSQRDVISNAINTGAGSIQLAIQQGRLRPGDVAPIHPTVQTITSAAFQNVAESQKALGVTPFHAAQMVVARWATMPRVMNKD